MNIVYNASAGTGKTYQVTQLYEKLVLVDGIDPREILLMTFTDNAAAELRMRVAQRLLKARRTAEADGSDERAERAISASSKLASATIGTIHSFCTRLLREHALEAGLSPGFAVLVGDDRDDLLHQICRDELLTRLVSDPDFKTFCAGAHIIGSGNSFGSSITETIPKLIAQAGSLGIPLENAEALLPDPEPSAARIDFERICQRIRNLPNLTPTVKTALDIIRQALEETEDVESLVRRLNELGIRKFGRGDATAVSNDFWELKTAVEDAITYRDRLPAARAFARYISAVYGRFQQRKHELNSVDFDDQLRLAAGLLSSAAVSPDFKYVIVDEVQDTSRIQCDIIQSLWGEETSLVICGDKKQSIYTWRGADPQVMPDLIEAIERRPSHDTLPLQTSYRSKAPILAVINKLFTTVYGSDEYSEDDHLQPNADFATDGEKPCIEFLTPDGDDEDGSKQEKVAAEMQAVANRIRLLTGSSNEWSPAYRYERNRFNPTDRSNAYRYADILILLRRTTHQPALEQALRHAGIPYTLGGKGRGLFTRQETRDVSLFLNILTNPADAFSLIGFLRSPWVGLSDEAIAELAWSDDGFSVDHLMARYAEQSDVIDRYRELLGTRLASELVRMLIDETGYDALLAGLPRGTQRLANLRKVLDWLRDAERGAHTTPAAVARKLAEQIADPPQIPEAALLDPAQNAVTIMTVHGAKGLTRRVVFVPDMSFSDNADRSFAQVFFDEQHQPRLGLRITAPDRSSVKSPGFEAAARRAAAVRARESNNLFYVAMTRARDLVVTSASAGRKPAGWLQAAEPLLGTDIPAIPYSTLAKAAETPQPNPRTLPKSDQLSAALTALPPPPKGSGLQRIAATKLAGEQDQIEVRFDEEEHSMAPPSDNAAAIGSLGHAVLEQLALNDWQGSVADWLERLRDGFSVGKTEAAALKMRIEETRDLMAELTDNMNEVRPEFPFVLHRENKLIDGTIDLLCRTSEGAAIFDYKFTETNESEAAEQYRGQMEIYRLAAQKCFPGPGAVRTELILISSRGLKRLPLVF